MKRSVLWMLLFFACGSVSVATAAMENAPTRLPAETGDTPSAYLCAMGERERLVEVVYADAGQVVPCEVQYQKEGQTEVLWRANHKAGYCERKTQWFIKKLRRLGWRCSPIKLLTSLGDERLQG